MNWVNIDSEIANLFELFHREEDLLEYIPRNYLSTIEIKFPPLGFKISLFVYHLSG